MSSDDVLLVEVADRVATVTLNRPGARNALNSALRKALHDGMRALDEDDDVDVVVLTGADPAFCAGLDLKELGASSDASVEALGSGPTPAAGSTRTPAADPQARGPFPLIGKPVIGAINGVAITGGFEVALRCDLLVASERAAFADTHARVGIMPDWGLTVLLPQAVGVRRAREMSATGNFVDAATAYAWGLVNHVVPHDELLPFAGKLARDIVSNDRVAVRRMFTTYRDGALVTTGDAWLIETQVAATWQGGGLDPAEIERRRGAVAERGRAQI